MLNTENYPLWIGPQNRTFRQMLQIQFIIAHCISLKISLAKGTIFDQLLKTSLLPACPGQVHGLKLCQVTNGINIYIL